MDVFSSLLHQLITDLPGALRAVFVDWEGEAVGQTGDDPDAARLMGAHWGVVHGLAKKNMAVPVEGLVLSFEDRHVVVKPVADGYLVVCETSRRTSPGQALWACARTATLIREEM